MAVQTKGYLQQLDGSTDQRLSATTGCQYRPKVICNNWMAVQTKGYLQQLDGGTDQRLSAATLTVQTKSQLQQLDGGTDQRLPATTGFRYSPYVICSNCMTIQSQGHLQQLDETFLPENNAPIFYAITVSMPHRSFSF